MYNNMYTSHTWKNTCNCANTHTHTHTHTHTKDNADPKNLILLCTTQGLAVQQDGRGTQKLFHHSIAATGKVHRHWLEAERSTHKVGWLQISCSLITLLKGNHMTILWTHRPRAALPTIYSPHAFQPLATLWQTLTAFMTEPVLHCWWCLPAKIRWHSWRIYLSQMYVISIRVLRQFTFIFCLNALYL